MKIADLETPPGNKPTSTAEVYALALRRTVVGSSTSSARPADTGWRKIVLPWHEPLTVEDLREDLNTGLIAAGNPGGATVYRGEEVDRGAEVIFSPAAAAVFQSMKIMKGAVQCKPPSLNEATLLCGDKQNPLA